ncbi:DUF2336 domain-containing protein [soil metagenome]
MSQSFGHALDGLGDGPVDPGGARRSRVVDSVAALCAAAPRGRTPEADAALAQALLSVIAQAEREVRTQLAHRIALEDWAPHAVVTALALDEIEVARPLLAHSLQLQDADLLRVLEMGALDHRVEVARRPHLNTPVSDRVAEDAEAPVLAALSANERTTLSPAALARLVTAARRISALRGPLSRRADLTTELAGELFQVVGDGLREELSRRFDLPAASLRTTVQHAVADVADGGGDRAEMERRLVEKLSASGELRSGFLLKSLRDGRLGLFEEALAVLGRLPRAEIGAAVAGPGPERLALACTAAGLDRSVFPTLLALVRGETGGAPRDTSQSMLKVRSALTGTEPEAARRLFMHGDAG